MAQKWAALLEKWLRAEEPGSPIQKQLNWQ